MFDLSKHVEYGGPGGFGHQGYRITTWKPGVDEEAQRVIVIHASKDDEVVREIIVPMEHDDAAGVHINDAKRAEDAIADLKATIDRIGKLS